MILSQLPYTPSLKLRDMIADNSLLLMSISRFGLPLRLANQPVSDICATAGVDTATFLAVANMVSGRPYDTDAVKLDSLVAYLRRAHSYFLDFFLPSIRRKFIVAVDFARSNDVVQTILRFFDDYVGEVRRHMDYENDTLFEYINCLLEGRPVSADYSVEVFASHHDAISDKLKRLKDVLVSCCPEGNADMINSVLFDIINCESDFVSHCLVEDRLLVPAVQRAEATAIRTGAAINPGQRTGDVAATLGKREKEIVACIARGLSNKEIAARLCISVHTVATHRRNICQKLEIHSPAGLTVYAILNNIIEPSEVGL